MIIGIVIVLVIVDVIVINATINAVFPIAIITHLTATMILIVHTTIIMIIHSIIPTHPPIIITNLTLITITIRGKVLTGQPRSVSSPKNERSDWPLKFFGRIKTVGHIYD